VIRKPARKPSARSAGKAPSTGLRRIARVAPRLTRETVVKEAIRLLGKEGLDGVSLRSLAARLGVRAPSLYWHFTDKAALLGAMMEHIFLGCVASVPERPHWKDWMIDFASTLWRTQESVRDFGRLLLSTPLDEAQIDRIESQLSSRLVCLDIPLDHSLRIQASVQVLVTGWFIFAHTPFSAALSRKLDFRQRAEHDLALLLEGESRKFRRKG
jgi:TetR/AcrR family transcriptional regulator, tetracycline repressor protein